MRIQTAFYLRKGIKMRETKNVSLIVIMLTTLLLTGCSEPDENTAAYAAVVAAGRRDIGSMEGAITYVIAKRQATARQRQIAEQRARHTYAAMPPKKKVELKQKKVSYIAVDTEKDNRTSPKAEKSVMIWNTSSEEIVGNDVYDVANVPQVGTTAVFETYAAEYIGVGT
jgi:hypothetical protein